MRSEFFAGTSGWITNTFGTRASKVTGTKSRFTSYGWLASM